MEFFVFGRIGRFDYANVIYHWPDDGIVVLEKIFFHEPPFSCHSFKFYGKDQRGHKLPSGIYFYHLTVNKPDNKKEVFSGTKKMMIVK